MRSGGLSMQWAALAGIILVVVGLLGFVSNPIVGSDPNALIPTNTVHNVVHLLTGLLALYIAFGTKGPATANAVFGFGVLYAVIFVAVVVSPTLFGLFGTYAANGVEHLIHAGVALVSLAVGYMGRSVMATA